MTLGAARCGIVVLSIGLVWFARAQDRVPVQDCGGKKLIADLQRPDRQAGATTTLLGRCANGADEIVEFLSSPRKPGARTSLIRLLAASGDRGAKVLVRALDSGRPEYLVRLALIRSLGISGANAGVGTLGRVLREPAATPEEAQLAVGALLKINTRESIQMVADAMTGQSPAIRSRTFRDLDLFTLRTDREIRKFYESAKQTGLLDSLESLVLHGEPDEAERAAYLLGRGSRVLSRAEVARILGHPDAGIRGRFVFGLGESGDEDMLRVALLSDRNPFVLKTAIAALLRFGVPGVSDLEQVASMRRDTELNELIAAGLARAAASKDAAVARAAMEAIGEVRRLR